jgi:hypothetical protein
MSDSKKPEIPKALPILGERFTVRQQSGLQGNEGDGAVDGYQLGHRIFIDADNNTSKKWRTLLHESMHGALYVTGSQSELGEHLEEVVVQFMRLHGEAFLAAITSDT